VGVVFHSGDFKIDYTPVDGDPINLGKLAEIGEQGVRLMLCDSTNATRPGFTKSERSVGETLGTIFSTAKNRIIIATFSSNVHRVQKIIENACACGRKVAVSGRSMERVVNIASELGYLDIPEGTLVNIRSAKNIPDDQLVIITTGSQGSPCRLFPGSPTVSTRTSRSSPATWSSSVPLRFPETKRACPP
jgi:ribonuclease J